MNFYTISHTKYMVLPLKYQSYESFEYLVQGSFYWNFNDLESAGLHILTYGVNNLTLAVI